jgi:hypothetical protein
MLDRFRRLFGRSPRPTPIQEQIQEKAQQLHLKVLESQLSLYDMMVDPTDWPWIDTPEFFGWPMGPSSVPMHLDHMGRGEVLPVYLTWYQLKMIRDNSRKLCAFNEFAINATENRISYVCGKGFRYTVQRRRGDMDPAQDPLCQLVQAHLDRWMDGCDWCSLEQEIIRRCDRDGECFLRFFDTGHGALEVRFVEPEYIRPADEGALDSFGIHTAAGDVATVLGYDVVIDPTQGYATEFVPAADILHIKTNVDSTAKRGLPLLFPVRKNLDRADKLLRNASILAQVRATYAVIRKHTGPSASAIAAFQQTNATTSYQNPVNNNTQYMQQAVPGSILDIGAMTEYQFPSAEVDASQFTVILQAELRAIAARLSMPEYMLTSDASNANFASTMVAESPWVKHAERLQAFYIRKFGGGVYHPSKSLGVLWRVLKCAVEGGTLPADVLTEIDIQAEGPTLVVRDKLQETQRRQILHQNKALSLITWQQQEGLDPAVEQQNLAGEKPEPQAPPGGSAGPQA